MLRRLLFSFIFCATAAAAPLSSAQAEEDLILTNILSSGQTSPANVDTKSLDRSSNEDLIAEISARDMDTPPEGWAVPDDLWQRVRNGFAMRELDSPLVTRHEQWYASRPDYLVRMTERANRYLYFIVDEVEKRGMPTEIALLPMIESAFNPSAYSIANASGIWQFIPSTGKNYGMQQNWWYDGRRDIVSATRGALDYLQKLYDQFGDWELALAAYNWGEGAVQRAQERNMKRGLPIDYASLTMPEETRNYVPKLLAVKNLIARPWVHRLALHSIPNQPYFSPVVTTEHMDVKVAAQLADISMEEFLALNPAHSRPVMLQDNSNTILLPTEKVATFYSNLENYNQPLVNWQAYQSKKGERLDKLAPRFGLTVEKLKSINGISASAKISGGQKLLVPNYAADPDDHEFEAFNLHLAPSEMAQASSAHAKSSKGKVAASKVAASHGKSKHLASAEPRGKKHARLARNESRRSAPTRLASLSRTNNKPTGSSSHGKTAKRLHVASNP